MPSNLEKSAVGMGLEKVNFHSNHKEEQCQRMFKHHKIALISHASKVILNIFQSRLQQHMNWELPDVQAVFRKGSRARDQITNICWIIEKESSRKPSTSASLTVLKPLTVQITSNWKVLSKWEY